MYITSDTQAMIGILIPKKGAGLTVPTTRPLYFSGPVPLTHLRHRCSHLKLASPRPQSGYSRHGLAWQRPPMVASLCGSFPHAGSWYSSPLVHDHHSGWLLWKNRVRRRILSSALGDLVVIIHLDEPIIGFIHGSSRVRPLKFSHDLIVSESINQKITINLNSPWLLFWLPDNEVTTSSRFLIDKTGGNGL